MPCSPCGKVSSRGRNGWPLGAMMPRPRAHFGAMSFTEISALRGKADDMKYAHVTRSLMAAGLLLASACSSHDPAESFARARQEFAAEDYASARTDVLAALESDSDNREMLTLLVRAQLLLGDGDGAQATLTRLKEAGWQGPELVRMAAEAALLRDQPGQTLSLLGNDSTPDAWRLRAAAHVALDESPAALEAFRKGMVAGEDFQLARDYARFLLAAQDYAGAEAAMATVRKLGPARMDALQLEGEIAQSQNRLDEAQAAFGRAAKAFPARIEPLLALSDLADMRGKLDEASAYLARATAIAPRDSRVIRLTVQLASEKGEWEKVRMMLAPREASLDPRSLDGLTYAEAMLRLGHPEQARAIFAKALLLSAQNPYARLMLAESQLATGDGASALRTIRPLADSVLAGQRELDLAVRAAKAANDPTAGGLEARLRSPQLIEWQKLSAAGQAALARHDWAAAIDAYRRIPGYEGDAEVLKRLAFASSQAGRNDEAIGFADRALTIEPRNADMLHVAGLARLNAGRDREAALRLMERACELDPANKLFRADLARAATTSG